MRYLDLSSVNISCKTSQSVAAKCSPSGANGGSDSHTDTETEPNSGTSTDNESASSVGAETRVWNEASSKWAWTPTNNGWPPNAKNGWASDAKNGWGADMKNGWGCDSKDDWQCGSKNGWEDDVKTDWEPYTTERLSKLPHSYKILTNVVEAFHFDFCDFSVSIRTNNVHFMSFWLNTLYI